MPTHPLARDALDLTRELERLAPVYRRGGGDGAKPASINAYVRIWVALGFRPGYWTETRGELAAFHGVTPRAADSYLENLQALNLVDVIDRKPLRLWIHAPEDLEGLRRVDPDPQRLLLSPEDEEEVCAPETPPERFTRAKLPQNAEHQGLSESHRERFDRLAQQRVSTRAEQPPREFRARKPLAPNVNVQGSERSKPLNVRGASATDGSAQTDAAQLSFAHRLEQPRESFNDVQATAARIARLVRCPSLLSSFCTRVAQAVIYEGLSWQRVEAVVDSLDRTEARGALRTNRSVYFVSAIKRHLPAAP